MTVLMTLLISALSQGMLYAPMALGVFITFRILKTPDLTVDGSFVFGMTVCAAVTVAGYPIAALVCGALAGALAGLCTALLQTRARVEPILSGILVSTGLYTVNYAVLAELAGLSAQRRARLKEAAGENIVTKIQMIFQDPIASLDPRMTVREIIAEGLRIQGIRDSAYIDQKVFEVLEKVGLVKEHAGRYPHEFSGGQRQRIGIARAIIMNPELIIADEPVSALDVSIQAQVINLLNELRQELGLTILFIAHDLSVVKYFSDRIIVMYFGKIVEVADSDELFAHPLHPYTRSLLSAIPLPNPHYEKRRRRMIYVPGEAHDYSQEQPVLREVAPGHLVSCNAREMEIYLRKREKQP